jgi:ATP-dependent DNA helicase RecG
VRSLPGAGPVTAGRLEERGVRTVRDLLMRMPRGYDDLRRATPIAALAAVPDGTVVLVRGTVRRLHVFPRRLLDVFVEEGDALVRARWFRVPAAMARSFPKGSEIALAGAVRTATDGTRELLQPSVVTAALLARGDGGLGLRPRYGIVQGVKGRVLERMRGAALDRLGRGDDAFELVPTATRRRLALPTLAEALTRVHAPSDEEAAGLAALEPARRRLAFEAALVAQLAFLLRRAAAAPGVLIVAPPVAAAMRGRVEEALAFALTESQARALDEISVDLAGARPMRRMLVGDVGSGKTAVAFGAAALVAAAGGLTLMMVPTEVLADQQLRALGPLGTGLGIGIAALTGATPAAGRAAILADCAGGRVQLLIGTQALLGVAGELPRLGLVIVDEQHRFGVAQRGALGLSGGVQAASHRSSAPHLLSMSATPIPRSLALALHGDLDASFLTERPGGRPPPTAIVCGTDDERRAAYARLRDALAEGNQAFVICPVRKEARRPGAVTAVAQHARLRRELAPARVGLLHGALDGAAKEEALRAFADGRTDVLVATTVVELGIDVPNATVMIVEEADRLGLAQLHQLRGRVGRGARAGLCFLFASEGLPEDAPARARLGLCASLDDGFRLAEADLAARGFGDLWGTAQAGEGEGDGALGAASLAEFAELTALGRREAEALLAGDPALADPAHALLARAARARTAMLFAGEAG